MESLRKLNFANLIHVGVPDLGHYTFDEYRKNGYEHTPITGYCTSCEEKGCSFAEDDGSYRLTNISHGAHSSDFFKALKITPQTENWHQQPILFVYETPSLDYGIYKEVECNGYRKHPSKDWYWIHEDREPVSYPEGFRGGEYGGFVLSAIRTFRLANVYMTNLVKCGMNNDKGSFKSLLSYQEETISNCYANFLEKEILLLKPEIIFAVGSTVEYWVKRFIKDAYYVQQLPHPAGRRRGFRDEHYKAIYFWIVAMALYKAGIIDAAEGSELAKTFLENFECKKAP